MADSTPPFPHRLHDHQVCIDASMDRAEAACLDRSERFTENRRAVLKLLLTGHRPLGAYEILERFDWKKRRPAPAQIYRALAFLESIGLIHRIASRNAYLACSRPGSHLGTVFLVCEQCEMVAELEGTQMQTAINTLAEQSGFEPHTQVIEVTGLCPECTGTPAPDRAET
ncbi:MAG: Fur family transcriptional regulator [Gammaproteobacteria bacterium]|nr:Fur family transcriptional regulator [Gammaproteobacteria bacterium]